MQVTLEKLKALIADMDKISEAVQKAQTEYWDESASEFKRLLAEFNPKGLLSFPKMYRLMHCISAEVGGLKSPLDMGVSDPLYDGEYAAHLQRMGNMLLVPQSPYAQRFARVWMNPLEGMYHETPPTYKGYLANASLSHLGGLEAIPTNENNEPTGKLEFIPFDEIFRIVFLNGGSVRLAQITFEYDREEETYWVPCNYGYSLKHNKEIGDMTLFGQKIVLNDILGQKGLGFGVQDMWLTDDNGENVLFGLPGVAIIEFALDRKDPNVTRKALARGINPFDTQAPNANPDPSAN